ncbi:MAG: PKD domain-containing protein [Bacteroidetes bacterium]|nr:PKD domain-containing protein [Bacteroidota bacterium]
MLYSTRALSLLTCLLLFFSFSAKGLTASFTADRHSGCAGIVVNFTNGSSGATSYDWDFGDGYKSTLTNPSHTFISPGSHLVTLTSKSGSSSATDTLTITIYDTPRVYFRVDTAICLGSTITFHDSTIFGSGTASDATFEWNFGNGDNSTSENPTYSYGATGMYTVTLTVTNSAGCQSYSRKANYVHVYGPPSVNFSATPTVFCGTSGTTTFTSTIGGGPSPYTYNWDYGDGSAHGTTANPNHSYTSTRPNYDVKLVVTSAAGCKDSLTIPNYITFTHETASFSLSASTVCAGSYITVTNTSTPSFTSTWWDFGDGATSGGNPEVHAYSAEGNYTIKLVSGNGCNDSITKTVHVNPQPKPDFTFSPTQPCPAPDTIIFSNGSSGTGTPFTYKWDFGDTTYSTATNPHHYYRSSRNYDVKLIATNTYGCTDSVTKSNYVKISPLNLDITGNGTAASVGGCKAFTVNFAYNLTGAGGGTYPYSVTSTHWDFGDTSTSTAASPTHTYNFYGTYRVILNITTSNGCSAADTFTVHVGSHPTASFTATPTTTCIDAPVQFHNTSDSATDYSWLFGDGVGIATDSPAHVYHDAGIYTVTLIAYNNGCPDTLVRPNYITVNYPKADFNFNYNCDTAKKISLTNTSLGGTSYYWDFGDASTSTTSSLAFSHTYATTGTYTITLVAFNSTTGCHDTTHKNVEVTDPAATFTASDTLVCIDKKITFSSHLTGGTALTYSWIFDNTTRLIDTTSAVVFSFSTKGYHSAKVLIYDNRGCTDTFSKYNYIDVAKPTADFAGTPLLFGCVPLYVTLTDHTTDVPGAHITSWVWDFGDGSLPGSGTPVNHTYTSAGTFYVSLAVKDNVGCTDTLTRSGYIDAHKPVANFSGGPTNVCKNSPVSFHNASTGSGLTYRWDFGDGNTSKASSPSHSYRSLGTFTVKLVITDSLGCKDSVTKAGYITVVGGPTAAFSLSDTFRICSPLTVKFKDHSIGAVRINWYFGDPLSSVSHSDTPSWTYINPGVYTVTEIVFNSNGCTDTARATVRILGYAGLLTYTPLSGCAPLTVNFKVNATGVPDFIYDFADGTTKKTKSPTYTYTYTAAGPYLPRVILTDDSGCTSASLGLDTIKVDGIYPGFTYIPFPACDSGTFEFVDTSSGAYSRISSHQWIFHDGPGGTALTDWHSYSHPGKYAVTIIDQTLSGCIDTFASNIEVFPLPTIDAGPDTTICVGDYAVLTPTGGVSYTWTPVATLSCDSCTNPQAKPGRATVYTVIGTDANGCSNTDTVTVFTKTKTSSVSRGGGEICQSEHLQLFDSAGVNTIYTWLPPYGLDDSHSDKPIASPDTTVHYIVIAQQGSCVPDTGYIDVIVHPTPIVSAGPNQTMIAGNTVQLDATGKYISKYLWSPADNLSCDSCESPIASPKKTTQFIVHVWSDFGCADSSETTIRVICDHSQVFMPNTFTPNGDGQNDRFYPRGKGLQTIRSFRIYNRWGQLMYEKQGMNVNEKDNGWDGTFNGVPLTPDVYVYMIDAICDTGEPISWKGDISLIR